MHFLEGYVTRYLMVWPVGLYWHVEESCTDLPHLWAGYWDNRHVSLVLAAAIARSAPALPWTGHGFLCWTLL